MGEHTLSAPRAFAQSQRDCLLKPYCGLDQSNQNCDPHSRHTQMPQCSLTAEHELRKSGRGDRSHSCGGGPGGLSLPP